MPGLLTKISGALWPWKKPAPAAQREPSFVEEDRKSSSPFRYSVQAPTDTGSSEDEEGFPRGWRKRLRSGSGTPDSPSKRQKQNDQLLSGSPEEEVEIVEDDIEMSVADDTEPIYEEDNEQNIEEDLEPSNDEDVQPIIESDVDDTEPIYEEDIEQNIEEDFEPSNDEDVQPSIESVVDDTEPIYEEDIEQNIEEDFEPSNDEDVQPSIESDVDDTEPIYEEDIEQNIEEDLEPSNDEDVQPSIESDVEGYSGDEGVQNPSGIADEVEQSVQQFAGVEEIQYPSEDDVKIESDANDEEIPILTKIKEEEHSEDEEEVPILTGIKEEEHSEDEEIENTEYTILDNLDSPTKERMKAAKDDTTVLPDDDYPDPTDFSFKYDLAIKKRDEEAQAMRDDGWTDSAVELYTALSLRGYEPLLPQNWWNDFDTMPTPLFAVDDEIPFIDTESKQDFRAIQALRKLVLLGPRVRDAVLTSATTSPPPRRRAEGLIERGIKEFSKWAFEDADVHHRHNLPILTTVAGPLTQSAHELEAMLRGKLDHMWDQWVAALATKQDQEQEASDSDSEASFDPPTEPDLIAPIPTLYGVLISNTLMMFVAYERSYADYAFRTVATFNFREIDYDVWTSLAIAILVIHCRYEMERMDEHLRVANSPMFMEDDPDM